MKDRFGGAIGDPFREFILFRLREGQPIKDYFKKKWKLGDNVGFRVEHIISALTDGTNSVIDLQFASLCIDSPVQ